MAMERRLTILVAVLVALGALAQEETATAPSEDGRSVVDFSMPGAEVRQCIEVSELSEFFVRIPSRVKKWGVGDEYLNLQWDYCVGRRFSRFNSEFWYQSNVCNTAATRTPNYLEWGFIAVYPRDTVFWIYHASDIIEDEKPSHVIQITVAPLSAADRRARLSELSRSTNLSHRRLVSWLAAV
ncbi:MAG: hypothetical protein KAI66_01495, partial [Lentisphaeria bacterium]|nr:hypothetical protein [Lentisphaeria bacterium]